MIVRGVRSSAMRCLVTCAMLASDNPLERWHTAVARVPTDSLLPLGFGNPTNEANVAAFLGDKLLGVAVASVLYRDTPSAQKEGIGRLSDFQSTATANKLLCEELVTILPTHAGKAVLELAKVQQHNAGTMVEAAVAAVHFANPDDSAPIAELASFLVARAREAGTFNFKGELLQRGGNITNSLSSKARQARRYKAEATLDGARALGTGPSKISAEQQAARRLFDALGIDAADLVVRARVRVPLPPSPADIPPADGPRHPSAALSADTATRAVSSPDAAADDADDEDEDEDDDDDEDDDHDDEYSSARSVAASTVAAARASAVRGRGRSPLQRATSAAAAAAASAQRRAFGGRRWKGSEWSLVRLREKDAVANLASTPPLSASSNRGLPVYRHARARCDALSPPPSLRKRRGTDGESPQAWWRRAAMVPKKAFHRATMAPRCFSCVERADTWRRSLPGGAVAVLIVLTLRDTTMRRTPSETAAAAAAERHVVRCFSSTSPTKNQALRGAALQANAEVERWAVACGEAPPLVDGGDRGGRPEGDLIGSRK